jgi:hypothetical protein
MALPKTVLNAYFAEFKMDEPTDDVNEYILYEERGTPTHKQAHD